MKFCTRCGAQVEEGKAFCSRCGNRLSPGPENIQNPMPAGNPVPPAYQAGVPAVQFKMTRKQKTIALIALCILVLGFVGYRIGVSLTGKERVISKFEQALVSKDGEKIAKCLKSSDPRMKIDGASVKSLLQYLDEDPSYMRKLMDSINSQASTLDSMKDAKGNTMGVFQNDMAGVFSGNSIVTLKKDGSAFFIFDRYVLEVKPYFMNISTNYKGTKIFINDEEVCTSDKDGFTKQLGPFMPGLYRIKADYKGDYTSLDGETMVVLMGNTMANVDIPLDGYSVTVRCDFDDARVFINGKDTGKTLEDAQLFGPVPRDGSASIYAQKDFPWGTVKGEEVSITGSSNIYLPLSPVNDAVTEKIMESVNENNKSIALALTERDITKLVNVTDKKRQEQAQRFESIKSSNQFYKGTYTKGIFDLDSVVIYKRDGKYMANINAHAYYNSVWYYEGSSNVEPYPNDEMWRYILVYDEASQKWLVDELNTLYSMDPVNKKEFNF